MDRKIRGSHYQLSILMTSDVINIEIFTTRVDTIFGVTAIVIAPDHPLVDKLSVKDRDEVKKYIGIAAKKAT